MNCSEIYFICKRNGMKIYVYCTALDISYTTKQLYYLLWFCDPNNYIFRS